MPKPPPRSSPRSSPRPELQKTTDWSDVAAWYDALVGEAGSEYHRHVVLPGVLRLLDARPGQRVLDVACGQGVLCRLLNEKGVATTGVDAARDLIVAARGKAATKMDGHSAASSADPRLSEFKVGDARDLSALPEATFDAAACVLAIQNIHPIRPVFDSVAGRLKPMGRFVVVMMHPAFRGAKESHWGWDETSRTQFRRVDRYLVPRKSPIVAHPGQTESEYTWTFHKPIEAYVKAARQAGMLVDALEEWTSHKTSQPGPRQAAENQARKEIPMFLAIRCIKAGVAAEPQ